MRRKSANPDQIPWPCRRDKWTGDLALEVGYIIFFWNCIENMLDSAFDHAIESSDELRVAVRSRINGLEGKLEVVHAAVGAKGAFSPEEQNLLAESLAPFMGYKQARDDVVHVRISNLDREGIAPTFERRGDVMETLVTPEALAILNRHLEAYQWEMDHVAKTLLSRRGARPRKHFPDEEPRRPQPQFETLIQRQFAALRNCQAKRKSLPQLPKFPVEVRLVGVSMQAQARPFGVSAESEDP